MKILRIYKPLKEIGDVIVFFDIEVSGFRINGFRYRRGDYADYVSMPARQASNKKWYPIAYPTDSEVKKELIRVIIEVLKEVEENKIIVETIQENNVEQNINHQKELTAAEKIEISRNYLPQEFISREGSKAMRSGIYGDIKRRSRE